MVDPGRTANPSDPVVGWLVGIFIVALAILAMGYLMFSADRRDAKPEIIEFVTSTLVIDHETGCEYVDGSGTTPRLGRDGRHICRDQGAK